MNGNRKANRIVDMFERHELLAHAVSIYETQPCANDVFSRIVTNQNTFCRFFVFENCMPVVICYDKENEDGLNEWHLAIYDYSSIIDAVFEYSDEFMDYVQQLKCPEIIEELSELVF